MFSTLVSATLLSALAIQGAFADFTINTISLTQCDNAHVTWSETTGPYNLAVVPVDDPCNTILVDLGDHSGLSMTWYNVSVAAGTKVMFSLLDADDNEAWSGEMTVADGDSSCLPGASSAVSDVSSVASDASGSTSDVSASATTLLLTSTYARSASSASETATIVGAANAGLVGNSASSGALANVQLPLVATIASGLLATVAMLAL